MAVQQHLGPRETCLNHAIQANTRRIVKIRIHRLPSLNPGVPTLNQENKFHLYSEELAEPAMGVSANSVTFMMSSLVFQFFLVMLKVS